MEEADIIRSSKIPLNSRKFYFVFIYIYVYIHYIYNKFECKGGTRLPPYFDKQRQWHLTSLSQST